MEKDKILITAIEVYRQGCFLSWYEALTTEERKILHGSVQDVLNFMTEAYNQLPDEVKEFYRKYGK